ncbi:exodeoxyribonuclease VII large subunit [Hymenobacter guriensis]|uniref:Exodeoxyribonuclease 7 large subunit n=1 Tax=Hymenobacter guriensis TaxID=2793065 RepID=A0ABS0KWE8_9BACT|nr:exodeoxyribonuclease VII large subunit [Hymenobacter guriensis]MBG8552184.1 exodeoxyribonuclease VII large subunit [Hymenobacter guriensis]
MAPLYNRRVEGGLPPQAPAPLGLAELMRRVRDSLTLSFPDAYWVAGEISDLTLPRFGSGHCYLTLTDQAQTTRGAQLKAQARATIWGARFEQLGPQFERQTGQTLRPGLRVLVRVSVKFHEQYGLSLDVLAIDPSYTVGDLARQRIEAIAKLEAQGLLERQKQLALALAPQRLAVISSPTAAGWQDFLQQLGETVYDFSVTLFPATMQGQESPASIRAALDMIRRRRGQFDAVVLIRGGGSKTDLLAFDDYGLAAAIGSFPLPVLTGIGHERDEAVVDLAAHLALKTPTAVAVFLTERLARLDAVLEGYGSRIRELAQAQRQGHADRLLTLAHELRHAAKGRYRQQQTLLEGMQRQTTQAAQQGVQRQAAQLAQRQRALRRAAHKVARQQQQQLRQLGRALAQRFRHVHRRRRELLLRSRYRLQLRQQRVLLLHGQQLALAEQRQYFAAASLHVRQPNGSAVTLHPTPLPGTELWLHQAGTVLPVQVLPPARGEA